MQNFPLISVIVPVYNVGLYLKECLDSIIAQTYKNLEIILVDDGSTDDCPMICDEYEKKDDRIVVIHQKNGGLGAARNSGLEISKGEYVGFVDSDDVIHPEMFGILLGMMGGRKDIITMVHAVRKRELLGSIIDPALKESSPEQAIIGIFTKDSLSRYVVIWNKLYPKALIGEIRFGSEPIQEDAHFNVRVVRNAKLLLENPSTLYYWRERYGSLSQSGAASTSYGNLKYFPIFVNELSGMSNEVESQMMLRGYKILFSARYHNRNSQWTAEVKKLSKDFHSRFGRILKANKHVPPYVKFIFLLFYHFPFAYAWLLRFNEMKARSFSIPLFR